MPLGLINIDISFNKVYYKLRDLYPKEGYPTLTLTYNTLRASSI
ncbi:uncharacterized protein FTOL_13972 [Fusarium torulosum]|uniref:Uncharacterized protein n=1 Tax=Fusarium torulosum TaxID=33205 RepID=A0AAE8MPI9_9HYPO|nr:uncharacterized protein FTOL_13972 [Fusarium torulosum]